MLKNRRYIVFGVVLLLFVCLILLLAQCQGKSATGIPNKVLKADEGAVNWEGEQNLAEPQTSGTIAIPGFSKLTFGADHLQQQVNFYNPATNNCLFLMSLYVEEELYWQSGYVEAGKGYYQIELSDCIPAGLYDAELRIRCFRESGQELNSAKVTFDLTVLEDN